VFKEKKFFVLFLLVVFLAASCTKFELTTPSDVLNNPSSKDYSAIVNSWDSYIVVHPFNPEIQKPHLLKLIESGVLRGVRLERSDIPDIQNFARWFISHGVEVLGLFENEHLSEPNVCQIFSRRIMNNRQITTWQIGNEVQNFVGMGAKEYVSILRKLFLYTRQHHPHIVIASQASVGTGKGADTLRKMIDAGLDKLCYEGLPIVAIHYYSHTTTRLDELKSQIARIPISTRIWVTETNIRDWNQQIGYVQKVYPMIRSLRVERIYCYVFSGRNDYSLVKGLPDGLPAEYSPLMKLLSGESASMGVNSLGDKSSEAFVQNSTPDNNSISDKPNNKSKQRIQR